MSQTLARLDAFFALWRGRLCEDSASVSLTARALDAPPGLHITCADTFVSDLGYQPIGASWELLDAEAGLEGARSALAAMVQAFSANMVFPSVPWLGEIAALDMARAFLDCFDPATRQIVTNHMYFGWNPITDATFEWAFVAYDDEAIALLLATDED